MSVTMKQSGRLLVVIASLCTVVVYLHLLLIYDFIRGLIVIAVTFLEKKNSFTGSSETFLTADLKE